ncbi:MAG: 50S ribosomal protein L6 [Syntrophales bacterium]|jgi:large subunit ribosomal protein L6|nr:50S ribosomal protein L6 [Syntrophales bacterium]MDP3096446.1 50S ribosomal protein L6 [Syntrophales bacterium]
MSRIGKIPVEIPAGVKVSRDHSVIRVEGPKGKLSLEVPGGVDVILGDRVVEVTRPSDGRIERSLHGLVRTLVANMVKGVSIGFEKSLEISGVGYRAEVGGSTLKLIIGFSAPVEYPIPEGVHIKVDKLVNILVSGIDKQLVGRVAAEIRSLKKPEPYKGKGIKYLGEQIRRKVGKSVGA